MTLKMGVSLGKSAPYLVRYPWVFCKWRYGRLICDVISQDNLIEESYEFLSGSSSRYVTILTNLVTIDIVKWKLHKTSPNHVIEGSCNVMSENSSSYFTILVVKAGDHRYWDSRNVFSLSRDLAWSRD